MVVGVVVVLARELVCEMWAGSEWDVACVLEEVGWWWDWCA